MCTNLRNIAYQNPKVNDVLKNSMVILGYNDFYSFIGFPRFLILNSIQDNPCYVSYKKLGYNEKNWNDIELHIKVLIRQASLYKGRRKPFVDDSIKYIQDNNKPLFLEMCSVKEFREYWKIDSKTEDLSNAYNISKNVEGDFY